MAIKIVPSYLTIPEGVTIDQLEKFIDTMNQGLKDVQAAYTAIKDNTDPEENEELIAGLGEKLAGSMAMSYTALIALSKVAELKNYPNSFVDDAIKFTNLGNRLCRYHSDIC